MGPAFFDTWAATYDETTRSRNFQARERVFGHAAKLALGRAGENPVCVDVGVGTGALTRSFAALGFHVVGCDSSAEMLKFAAANVPSAELRHADALDFLDSLPPSSADFVSSSSVLEYLADPLAVVRLAAPVLRVGGIFAVSLPERLSLSRLLLSLVALRTPRERLCTSHWGSPLTGRELEEAAARESLRLVRRSRFGSFEYRRVRLPFEAHRPIATLCLYVFERVGS
ncbi:MAG TPA: class I SAM-dependent methyltransferase [Gaiellaceae bacterium]